MFLNYLSSEVVTYELLLISYLNPVHLSELNKLPKSVVCFWKHFG